MTTTYIFINLETSILQWRDGQTKFRNQNEPECCW